MFLDSICFNNNQLQLNNSWHVLLYCRCLCSVWLGTCFFAPRACYASELQTASVPSFKFDCEGRLNQRTTQSKALCTTWHATTLGLDQVVANLPFACLILPEKNETPAPSYNFDVFQDPSNQAHKKRSINSFCRFFGQSCISANSGPLLSPKFSNKKNPTHGQVLAIGIKDWN